MTAQGFTSYIKAPAEDQTVPQIPPKENYKRPLLDLFSLKGKVSVITGAAGAIGGSIATGFAQAGSDIVIVDYKDAPEFAASLEKEYGIRAKSYQLDITNSGDVSKCIDQIVEDFGTIDVFIANAGIAWTNGTVLKEDSTPEMWRRVFDVNVHGAFYCAKYVATYWAKIQKKGSLIFTASMSASIVNVPNYQTCYNASKAAVKHMSKSLAVEFASHGIRVNSVSPGYTDTVLSSFVPTEQRAQWWGLTPFGREALPEELVGAYLYLASDASTFTSGADINVDGAYTCV